MTDNGTKLVGRAVLCPPDAWIDKGGAHGVTSLTQIVCHVHNPRINCFSPWRRIIVFHGWKETAAGHVARFSRQIFPGT
jgi:hypothetical protein